MSWETVEALPGAPAGDAFRGSAEPVVAERRALTAGERLRLFWHSDPDHPFARAVSRVVVTPAHVYVERRDGSRARVPLAALHGERLERGRVVYGVKDGDDLLLPYRAACAVQDRLAAAVRGGEPVEPWRRSEALLTSASFAIVGLAVGVGLYLEYPLADALDRLGKGLYTAESVLGTLTALAAVALGAHALLWWPSRWRIDGVAVTRARGVVPWLSFSVPPERFRRAVVKKAFRQPKNAPRVHAGWTVALELREPTRIGSLAKLRALDVRHVLFRGAASGVGHMETLAEAKVLAERLRALLGLEETVDLSR